MMFIISICLLLVAAVQSAPRVYPIPSDFTNRLLFPVLDGSPKYPTSRIVNGYIANRGQFPHQAALSLGGTSLCGGSLISTSYVLTAAHCLTGIRTVTVYLGVQSLNNIDSQSVVTDTRQLMVYAAYNATNMNNDIALLKLENVVTLSSFIQTIGLPKYSDASKTFVGLMATSSGFGRYNDSSSDNSIVLRYVDFPVISNAQCSLTYGTSIVTSSAICVSGSGGRSTCTGDSGGPLIVTSDNRKFLIGVDSFGASAGCSLGYPIGFTRVTSYLSWISTNTGISIGS